MNELIPDKRKLVSLVEQAQAGRLCLPDFQRDFIWTRDAVADLIRSVVRRYFIGSLLLLRCDPQNPPFAPMFLQGAAPTLRTPQPELLVLDGQQRLTALVYALAAPDLTLKDSSQRRWFFLDLQLLTEDAEDDEIIFDRAQREMDHLDDPEVQYERRILPCTKLLRYDVFQDWLDGFDEWLETHEPDKHRLFKTEWRKTWRKTVSDFQAFDVPLVELPRVDESDTASIGRVCAIFEKLNSTGVELSVYDLLTARLYRSNIRLHELWEEACKNHARLADWSGGKADTHKLGVLVLRTLALLRGQDPKPRVLIDLKPEGFQRDWQRAAAAVERALELITLVAPDGFGVFDWKWLPAGGLLPVLAALRAEIDERKLGEAPRADLRRWYWCNVFLERYSSAVESKSRKDYSEMLAHWIDGKPEPSVFTESRARIESEGYSVRDAASYASAVYSGVFCLLALRGARDWSRRENIQLQELEDHHIFPQAYLRRHGLTARNEVNRLANRTLLCDETNRRIRDQAPAVYSANPILFPSKDASLLEAHFFDPVALQAIGAATDTLPVEEARRTYARFVQAREAAIVREIRNVCRVAPVAEDQRLGIEGGEAEAGSS